MSETGYSLSLLTAITTWVYLHYAGNPKAMAVIQQVIALWPLLIAIFGATLGVMISLTKHPKDFIDGLKFASGVILIVNVVVLLLAMWMW